jgi:hypothetical protein
VQDQHGYARRLTNGGVTELKFGEYFARVKLKIFGDPYTLLLLWIGLSACRVGSKHKRRHTEQTAKHTAVENCHSVSYQAIGLN